MKRSASRSGRARAIALLVAALAAPARADGYDPYRIARAQFREQVARLVLRPLVLPAGTPDAERVRSDFEALIADALTRRGYAVVSSRVFADTWQRFSGDLGGVFDPVTGRPDPKKYELAWQHSVRELERSHEVDAVLSAEIAIEPMAFGIGWWWWEAAGQPLRWQGHKLPSAPNQQPQRVEGPYLGVVIQDRAQVPLYEGRLALAWSRIYLARGYEEVPPAELYADRARNREAVEQLLSVLVDRKAGDGDRAGSP